MLRSYVDRIIGDHKCGFQHNSRSTTDQILEKNEDVMGQYLSYLYILRIPMTQERNIVQYSH